MAMARRTVVDERDACATRSGPMATKNQIDINQGEDETDPHGAAREKIANGNLIAAIEGGEVVVVA